MTGKEKIRAAFTDEGSREIAAVLCYDDLFYRDHWAEMTSCPWWYAFESNIDKLALYAESLTKRSGSDWFYLPDSLYRMDRSKISIIVENDEIYRYNSETSEKEKLIKPIPGGSCVQDWNKELRAETFDDIDKIIPIPKDFDKKDFTDIGCDDPVGKLFDGYLSNLCPIMRISTPLTHCVGLWGFEGFMINLYENPQLVKYARDRYFTLCEQQICIGAASGAQAVWIEECYIDMISPEQYKEFNLECMRDLTDCIKSAGIKGIYYHCGDPWNKIDKILDVGADAVSFEESKKGFMIDIEDVVEVVNGRCTVLGNLDAIWFLPYCSDEELKSEIKRQISAGRKNGDKFIMSMGSPVTPGTPVEKVRLYCDLVHEIGR